MRSYVSQADLLKLADWNQPIEMQRDYQFAPTAVCIVPSVCSVTVLQRCGAKYQDRSKAYFFFSRLQMMQVRTKRLRRTLICPFKLGRSRNRDYHSPNWKYQRLTTMLARNHRDNLAAVDVEDHTWGKIHCSDTFIGNAAKNLSFNVRSVLSDANGRRTGCDIFADNTWTKSETWKPIY